MTVHFIAGIITDEINEAEELNKIASTDLLTGLSNRRKLEELYKQSKKAASRILMLIDLDHFKVVNDNYGHPVGDRVLKEFASLLKTTIREADTCYRWGGEEFVVILNNTNKNEAIQIGERLRVFVENNNFKIEHPLTVSIGLAEEPVDETLLELFNEADKALYYAKKKGRNRITCYWDIS